MMFWEIGGINSGERAAAKFLIKNKYKIIEQNYRCRLGEIDIIAMKDDILVFVEVKQRKNSDFGNPSDFVDFRKQRKIRKTAEIYLLKNKIKPVCRFDVIEVLGEKNFEITHIKNAF